MECQACNFINRVPSKFCESCGAALAHKCSVCGFAYSPAAKFCGDCGAQLALSLPAAVPIASVFTSGWGELKQATVLFADIVSSTEHIAKLDPEQVMDRLQPAVTLMCQAVERFGGTVIRTLGDGVMALFGVPKALEGHAALACEAALHMQCDFGDNAQGLSIRVGLHSGLVASDPTAADGGKGGGAHGMTIHLASRVVGVAVPGGIALTGDCYSLVSVSVEARSIGLRQLKGVPEVVEIFHLAGMKPAFASQHFHRSTLTLLMGRERELGFLQQALRMAEQGDSRIVGVSGAPGTGKSRLCFEFAQWSRARGFPVFEVRAQPYGSATPFQPVLELMRTFFFLISPGDPPGECRKKIADKLYELGPAFLEDASLLSEFLGVAETAAKPLPYHPKARRAKLLEVVRALVADCAKKASVILMEDAHWLDAVSEEFVAAFADAAHGTCCLLVLNYRPSFRSPWARLSNFHQIELTELSDVDADALVRQLISQHIELPDVAQMIAKRSGGNPFFAEELVRSLAESGFFSSDRSWAKEGYSLVEKTLPATVQAVVAARIDRLGEAEKGVLHTCAIVGKEVPLAVLQQVIPVAEGDLEGLLETLCQSEMIQPQPAVVGRRFSFRHPLIQEVAYASQLKARRNAIHASVAKAMETYYADQIDEFAGLISHHYEASGQLLNSARYASRAAQWVGATDSAQAIKDWRTVRVLLQDQPRVLEADRLRAMACSQICLLGWREGLGLTEVQPFIEEAMALADQVDNRLVQLLLTIEGRVIQASGGSADSYVERVQRALNLVAPGTDLGRVATLNAALSQAYAWAGLLEQGLAANNLALEGAARIDDFDQHFIGFNVEHWVLVMRGRLLTRLGRFQEAQGCLQHMLQKGESSIDPVLLQVAHYGWVDFAWCFEDMALAKLHSGKVSDIADKYAAPYLRVFALSAHAMVQRMESDYWGAIATLWSGVNLIRKSNVALEQEAELLAALAECHRRVAEFDAALDFANEALSLARKRGSRLSECGTLITIGAILVDQHGAARKEDARSAFDGAGQLIKLSGAKFYERNLASERIRLDRLDSIVNVSLNA